MSASSPPATTVGEVNPLWLRLWHTAQAVCVLGLLLTGLSLHYADAGWVFLPFELAVRAHDVLGLSCAGLWVVFVAANFASGNVRHYLPRDPRLMHDLWRQIRFYLWGMFRGEPAPFPPGLTEKFNPVQKLTYLLVMHMFLPVSIATGLLLLSPMAVPAHIFEGPGLWPIAIAHLAAGWLMALFLVVHVYLATTGTTVASYFREMVTGTRASSLPPPP